MAMSLDRLPVGARSRPGRRNGGDLGWCCHSRRQGRGNAVVCRSPVLATPQRCPAPA